MYFNVVKFTEKINTLFGKKTQTELAEMFGISQTMVSALKKGKIHSPGADTVFKIARYFNVSTDYLLGLEEGTTNQATADLDALGLDEESLNIILQAKGTDDARKIAFLLKNKDKIFDLIEGWEK